MNEISFREVDKNNFEEMHRIASADMAIPASYDDLFKVNDKTIQERLEQLMKAKPEDFFQVAVCHGKVVGFHFLRAFNSSHGFKEAGIQTLWVDPAFRRRGIAKKLKALGEQWAKEQNVDHISTFVSAKNASMLALNESEGFEIVGYQLRKRL